MDLPYFRLASFFVLLTSIFAWYTSTLSTTIALRQPKLTEFIDPGQWSRTDGKSLFFTRVGAGEQQYSEHSRRTYNQKHNIKCCTKSQHDYPALSARTLAAAGVVIGSANDVLRLRALRLAVRAIAQASSFHPSPNNAFLAVLTARTPHRRACSSRFDSAGSLTTVTLLHLVLGWR